MTVLRVAESSAAWALPKFPLVGDLPESDRQFVAGAGECGHGRQFGHDGGVDPQFIDPVLARKRDGCRILLGLHQFPLGRLADRPRQRTTAKEFSEAMLLLLKENRVIQLGRGYVCCSLSNEEVTADL